MATVYKVEVQDSTGNVYHPHTDASVVFQDGKPLPQVIQAQTTALNTKASKSQAVTATLTAAGWIGSAAPFTQSISISGIAAASNGTVALALSATAQQRLAARNALLALSGQAAGSITIVADGEKPTLDLPILVTIVG